MKDEAAKVAKEIAGPESDNETSYDECCTQQNSIKHKPSVNHSARLEDKLNTVGTSLKSDY